jgi:hypothetical protein
MKLTLDIDEHLLKKAAGLSGIQDQSALIESSLRALISREASRRLAAMGGTMPDLMPIPRRRSAIAEDTEQITARVNAALDTASQSGSGKPDSQ